MRGLSYAADRRERAGDRDVVDVVSGAVRERAGLTPPRHPRIDEPRIPLQHRVGAEPEALHYARPAAFDHDVDSLGELEAARAPLVLAEVDGDRAEHGVDDRVRIAVAARAIDPEHLRSEVRQQHGGVRAGTDPREFHDAYTRQRPWTGRVRLHVLRNPAHASDPLTPRGPKRSAPRSRA